MSEPPPTDNRTGGQSEPPQPAVIPQASLGEYQGAHAIDDKPPRPDYSQQAAKALKKGANAEWAMVFVASVTLVVSGFQCSFNRAQVTEMQIASALTREAIKQNEDALAASREAARVDQRAWISVGEVVARREGSKTIFKVTFSNSGKTPAIIDGQIAHFIVSDRFPLPYDQIPPIFIPDSSTSKGVVSAGVTLSLELESTDEDINAHLTDLAHPVRGIKMTKPSNTDSLAKSCYYYVDGIVIYRDIFNQAHHTRFCYYITGVFPVTGTLKIAPTRNKID